MAVAEDAQDPLPSDTPRKNPTGIENRVYINRKVKLVYAQYFKDIGVCSVRGRAQGLKHPHPSSTPDWCYKLPAYAESLLKRDDANDITVVLNSGLHGYSVATEELEVMSDMFQKTTSGTKADRNKTNLLIWKTTTSTQNGPPSPNVTLPATWEGARHSQVFDAAGIVDTHSKDKPRGDIYWDNVHFIGEVYHALHSELIAFIEDAKEELI
ncbi:hypothetical protein HDU88_002345 [Geranomyces variabilis]|nr:hypothetical protein HDU88_002345 [Geranomyces variabilis]